MNQINTEKSFKDFFYEKLTATHGDFYGGDNEKLKEHFESGNVRVPVMDVFKLVDEWFTNIRFKTPPVGEGIPTLVSEQAMTIDEKYIETYNKKGNNFFGNGDDEQLKEWGNSDEEIRKIKINCVNSKLKLGEGEIETYKMMNELCGGKNNF